VAPEEDIDWGSDTVVELPVDNGVDSVDPYFFPFIDSLKNDNIIFNDCKFYQIKFENSNK
jgi:hypothetical protein